MPALKGQRNTAPGASPGKYRMKKKAAALGTFYGRRNN